MNDHIRNTLPGPLINLCLELLWEKIDFLSNYFFILYLVDQEVRTIIEAAAQHVIFDGYHNLGHLIIELLCMQIYLACKILPHNVRLGITVCSMENDSFFPVKFHLCHSFYYVISSNVGELLRNAVKIVYQLKANSPRTPLRGLFTIYTTL